MVEEFKYKPPVKYLFVGLSGIVLFILFVVSVIEIEEIWVKVILLILSLMALAMGIGFLIIYIKKFNVGNIKIGIDFIEIPGRWKEPIKLKFKEIIEISEFDTYDNVIEIESTQGIHLIEKSWMKNKDFDLVKKRLQDYWQN